MIENIVSLFFSGLVFGSGPCVISCGPVLLSYLAANGKDYRRSLGGYALFSLGRLIAYCLLGLGIFFLGRFALERVMEQYSRFVLAGGGGFVVVMGILTAAGRNVESKTFNFCRRALLERDAKSITAMGVIVGLVPCAPLLAVAAYMGLASREWPMVLVYSLAFGLGTFISPLAVIPVFAGLIPRLKFMQQPRVTGILNAVCGAVLVFLGIQLIRRAF